jgi:hypothetical protein
MNQRQKDAMKHADVLGAGAAKRRKLPPKERGEVIAKEFERGTLHSGGGDIVKKPSQMRAIIYSEEHPKSVKDKHRSHKH